MSKKTNSKPYLVYALDKEGALVHVDDVPNGFGCGCICPNCKARLNAKNNGENNAHHFAHEKGSDCIGAVESALHLLAKEVLCETLSVQLPTLRGADLSGLLHFDSVGKEVYNSELALRPDCVGYFGDRLLWIEFKRTHAVDVHKEGKIISAKIDCIEIDLKRCPQDKEEIRRFLVKSTDDRKWIYNSQLNIKEANRRYRSKSDDDRYGYNDYHIVRHYAVDEDGNLANSFSDSEFDANKHAYYCPSCGKRVAVKVGNHCELSFEHVDEDTSCDDELYLKRTAIKVFHQTFSSSQKFVINVPQFHNCNSFESCNLVNKPCGKWLPKPYNLKDDKFGYTKCISGYRFKGATYQTDLVLFRDDDIETAISIFIDTENTRIEDEHYTKRVIRLNIGEEYDITRLTEPRIGIKAHYIGFKDETHDKVAPSEVEGEFVKFTFYRSGKYHHDVVKCMGGKFVKSKFPSVLRETVSLDLGDIDNGNNDHPNLRNYLLMRYRLQGLKLCYCHLCYFLRNSNQWHDNGYICIKYKTSRTPQNPLGTCPIDCPYFRMDNDISRKMNEISNKITIIEL